MKFTKKRLLQFIQYWLILCLCCSSFFVKAQYFALPAQSREYLSFQNPANVSPEKWRFLPSEQQSPWSFSKLSIAHLHSPLEESGEGNRSYLFSLNTHWAPTREQNARIVLGANLFSDQAGRLQTFMGGLNLGVILPVGRYRDTHYNGIAIGIGYHYNSLSIRDPGSLVLFDLGGDALIDGFNNSIAHQWTGGIFYYDRFSTAGLDLKYYMGASWGFQVNGKHAVQALAAARFFHFTAGTYVYLANANFLEPYVLWENREGLPDLRDFGLRWHFSLSEAYNLYLGGGIQFPSERYIQELSEQVWHFELGYADVSAKRIGWQLGLGYVPRNQSRLINTLELNAALTWR